MRGKISYIQCPYCGATLEQRNDGKYYCPAGHGYWSDF